MQLEKDRSRPEHAELIEREFYGVSGLKKGNEKKLRVKRLSLMQRFESKSLATS